MPQIRLTQKCAKDIKVNTLIDPSPFSKLLDDWAIDRLVITRKKVAMITHVNSLLTFFIPYNDVGGAKNIPECIGVLLSQWLYDQDLEEFGDQAIQIFDKHITYCKTSDRKLLGHMNDFKQCIEMGSTYKNKVFDDINWDEEAEFINNMAVKTIKNRYSTPTSLMLELLAVK